MPTVTATPFPDRDYVLVETDWTDTPGTTHVRAYRVRSDTGERTALYPYVAFDGSGCTMLNCGLAWWWDTDPPLGVPVTYEVDQCADSELEFVDCSDNFNRAPVAAGWGTSTSGCLWATSGGAAAQFSATGTVGRMAANTTANSFQQTLPLSLLNATVYGDVTVSALALTQTFNAAVMTRWQDGSNYYQFVITYTTSGTVQVSIRSVVAGVLTTLAGPTTLPGVTYAAGTKLNFKAVTLVTFQGFTVWNAGLVEPAVQVFAINGALPAAGRPGLRALLDAGNTNGTVNFDFDNIRAYDSVAVDNFQTVASAEVELAAGNLWLKNPLQPCGDLSLLTCGSANVYNCEDPDARQIVFSQMAEESFAANTVNLLPVNRRRPIPTYRERRDIESTLTLVTRTFADRDALRESLRPGYPLLFQAPSQYGIADRYMSIGTVTESRGLPDHRFQPRVVQLPHVVVDRPEGSVDGVCGARVRDLCDIYSSWDAITAVGLTYEELLLGAAGIGTPGTTPVSELNTWQDVLDENADWAAVNNGQDWEGVLEN